MNISPLTRNPDLICKPPAPDPLDPLSPQSVAKDSRSLEAQGVDLGIQALKQPGCRASDFVVAGGRIFGQSLLRIRDLRASLPDKDGQGPYLQEAIRPEMPTSPCSSMEDHRKAL